MCDAGLFLKKKKEFFGKHKKCSKDNIWLHIKAKGKVYKICYKCWLKIAESTVQW